MVHEMRDPIPSNVTPSITRSGAQRDEVEIERANATESGSQLLFVLSTGTRRLNEQFCRRSSGQQLGQKCKKLPSVAVPYEQGARAMFFRIGRCCNRGQPKREPSRRPHARDVMIGRRPHER